MFVAAAKTFLIDRYWVFFSV